MLTIDTSKCIGCQTCVYECPSGALAEADGKINFIQPRCNYCGHCLAACPRDAIIIDGDGYFYEDVEEFHFEKPATPYQIRSLIMLRRSVREYSDEEVTDDQVLKILEAGKYSPTARNLQGNMFLIVKSEDEREKLLRTAAEYVNKKGDAVMDEMPGLGQFSKLKYKRYIEDNEDNFFYCAPVIIFVFADNDLDGAIAAANMGFMANAQGLGYCFAQSPTEIFDDPEIRKMYDIPDNKKCVLTLLVGYPEASYFCSVPRKDPEIIWK